MEVILAAEAREADSGQYHVASDGTETSLCGVVNPDSPFASDVYRVVPKRRAEALGFDLCGRCDSISDR
ncbi:hypothetical protein M0R89_20030 (plasmid) [Halorussus limi]|uniref:Uncharacterized protein n=1 Tax=Halorussus limi TaxID=2938695 RepID=A0A8U0I0A3_9EURY|nr:hypothetical protein [Halorussus limi]UPV76453.1 hypothetical protein M0R89_20030 [Halorussus limi]